jgi:hypothetical protein
VWRHAKVLLFDSSPVTRRTFIALLARQEGPEFLSAPLGGDDPWAVGPWWIVPHMLVVATLKLGNPMLLIVLVVADDWSVHAEA